MGKGIDWSQFQRWEWFPAPAGTFPENSGRFPGATLAMVRRINEVVAECGRRNWWRGFGVGVVFGVGLVAAACELWKVVAS